MDYEKLKREHPLNAPSGVSTVTINKADFIQMLDDAMSAEGLRDALCLIEHETSNYMCDCNHPDPKKQPCISCACYTIAHAAGGCGATGCPVVQLGLQEIKAAKDAGFLKRSPEAPPIGEL